LLNLVDEISEVFGFDIGQFLNSRRSMPEDIQLMVKSWLDRLSPTEQLLLQRISSALPSPSTQTIPQLVGSDSPFDPYIDDITNLNRRFLLRRNESGSWVVHAIVKEYLEGLRIR
jgi:hypothetical protein